MDPHYQRWVKLSAWFTLSMALVIVAIKLFASMQTNASSMLASFTDAMLDVLVSGLNFIVLRFALKPADDEHRFGHGKAEAVMALFQAAFLTGAALLLLYQGVVRLLQPEPLTALNEGMIATLICMGLTLVLVTVQKWIITKTASLAVQADSAHYRSDLLMNGAVLFALWAAEQGWLWMDAVMAAVIAAVLCGSAWHLAKESLRHLLDEELDTNTRHTILATVAKIPGVLAVDQLRTRQSGPQVFIQLRLVVPDDWSLLKAHDCVDAAEHAIAGLFPKAEVIIHADPESALHAPEHQFS